MPMPFDDMHEKKTERSGSVLNLSEEELTLCAKSCVLLNRQIGIGSALTYLFGMLSEHFPLTRIFCGFRRYKTASFTPLADTLSDTHNRVRTLATTDFTQEQINLLMGSDSLRPYTINNALMLKNAQTSLREDFMATGAVRSAEKIGNPGGSASNRLRAMKGMHDLYIQLEQAAATDCTVLILGETGTGKELVANAVQELSLRSSRPFVKVNCGAINEQLVDSELFGHERGAFTGAYGAHTGYFEAANGGTVFLDEIGDLPLSMQARLLRVLDQREVRKVGSAHAIPLDIRVIAATHRDLLTMVRQGKFREDLWYRLNVCVLHVPPLRAHRSDIPALARLFLIEKSKAIGVNFPSLTAEQLEKLCQHNWPGNVRELEHLMERLLVRLRGGNFKLDDVLNSELEHIHQMDRRMPAADIPAPASGTERFVCPFSGAAPERQEVMPAADPWNGPVALHNLLRSTPWPSLKELTESYIDDALRYTRGRIGGDDGAAALLNVHPNTLRVRRQKKNLAG